MVIDENRDLVENAEADCECKFIIGEDGRPVVVCADEESQSKAIRAMAETGDVLVRVSPVVDHDDGDHDDGDHDDVDAAGDDVEEPEELELGFADDLDDDDDDEE